MQIHTDKTITVNKLKKKKLNDTIWKKHVH